MSQLDYWNHNVHYQPVILRAVPSGCGRALDVGCGDGLLACRLAERCGSVTGIDSDTHMVDVARRRAERSRGQLDFIEADFLTHPMADASFDFVCANTSLHHMDFKSALATMSRLLRPGGRLAVVGLAANGSAWDWVSGAAGVPAALSYRAVHGEGSPGAPVKDPDMTWSEVRSAARRVIPGMRWRRHLLWRYSLRWQKPD